MLKVMPLLATPTMKNMRVNMAYIPGRPYLEHLSSRRSPTLIPFSRLFCAAYLSKDCLCLVLGLVVEVELIQFFSSLLLILKDILLRQMQEANT